MRPLSWLPFCALAGALFGSTALLCSSELQAQNSSNSRTAPRITTNVDESFLAKLRGNVPHLARAEFDQGEAVSSTQLSHVRLILSRSNEQQAALDQYLAELQDKSSTNYHKWLTPAEFGKRYGPTDSDVAAIVAWLESHGLTLETISAGRTNIAFSGTVSQVEEAFHTSIHSFQTNKNQFYSNTTDPQIPAALATVVKGVAHLNTIKPRPHSVRGRADNADSQTTRLANRPRANLTDTTSNYFYIVPADAATIYNTPNSFNANYASGTSYTGTGVKIGVGGNATIDKNIVKTYRSTFLGSSYSTAPTLNYCTTSTSCTTIPGSGYVADDADEAYLDTELAGSMAPGATIYYYASTDLYTGIEAALTANLVDIFSLSFGSCERDMSTSDNAIINKWWEQAATQGIAVTVASGDNGSTDCDSDDTTQTATVAKDGLSVDGFASTPYNIAVGGTDFYALETSFSPYVSSTLGSASTYYRTAQSYIPESVWNDSIKSDTTLSYNVPWTGKYANIMAGGGGHSSCSTNNSVDNQDGSVTDGSCTSGYSKPSWQTGTGSYDSDGARDVPDISLMSGNGYDGAAWLVCNYDEPCTSISGSGDFTGYGGTSTAAPAFAGILALVEQKTGSRLGQAAKVLYDLHNGSYASSIFHDVTVGNNSVPCTAGTTDCDFNTAGYYFESGYDATTGYDLATGLGSVDATKLITYWDTAVGTATATVAVKPDSSSITTAEALSVSVTVTGSSTAPTGTVTLSGGSYTSSAESPQSTSGAVASYTFTIPAGSFSVGSDTITATYNADTTYGVATGTATVTVTTATTTSKAFTLSAVSPSTSITPGGTATSTVTVTAVDGYTGTVTLTCALTSYPSGATNKPTCSFASTVTLSSSTTTGEATATVKTTATTSSELLYPKMRGNGKGLLGAGGGAVLAFLVMLGIPARRRNWRSMLSVLAVLTALGGLAGCGSSISNSNNNSSTTGTTAGNYTFTVTGTGNDSSKTTGTTTFSVTVN